MVLFGEGKTRWWGEGTGVLGMIKDASVEQLCQPGSRTAAPAEAMARFVCAQSRSRRQAPQQCVLK